MCLWFKVNQEKKTQFRGLIRLFDIYIYIYIYVYIFVQTLLGDDFLRKHTSKSKLRLRVRSSARNASLCQSQRIGGFKEHVLLAGFKKTETTGHPQIERSPIAPGLSPVALDQVREAPALVPTTWLDGKNSPSIFRRPLADVCLPFLFFSKNPMSVSQRTPPVYFVFVFNPTTSPGYFGVMGCRTAGILLGDRDNIRTRHLAWMKPWGKPPTGAGIHSSV